MALRVSHHEADPTRPRRRTMTVTFAEDAVAGRPTLGPADRRRRRRRSRREMIAENETVVEAHKTSDRERCGRKKKKALTARERTTPPRSPEGPRMLKNSTSSSLSRSQSLITPEKKKRKKMKSKSRSPWAVALRVSHHEADPTRPRRRTMTLTLAEDAVAGRPTLGPADRRRRSRRERRSLTLALARGRGTSGFSS